MTDKEQEALKAVLKNLLKLPENKQCADCGASGPTWASTNLGVFVCMRCSGVHRGMGTHISKVKSVHLDKWQPYMVEKMKEVGNGIARAIYECGVPSDMNRDFKDQYYLEQWIRNKYERKIYFNKAHTEGGPTKKEKSRRTTKDPKGNTVSNQERKIEQPESNHSFGFEFGQSNGVSSTTLNGSQNNQFFNQNDSFFNQYNQNMGSSTQGNTIESKSDPLLTFGETETPKRQIDTQSILSLYSNTNVSTNYNYGNYSQSNFYHTQPTTNPYMVNVNFNVSSEYNFQGPTQNNWNTNGYQQSSSSFF